MTALEDHRPVAATTCPNTPPWIGAMLSRLLVDHSDLELASIRLIPNEDGTVGIAGRIGQLVEQTAEYDCCHQLEGRPHTDYCLNALPSSGEGLPLPEQRPDDDPADEITCNGRNCGGYPHA